MKLGDNCCFGRKVDFAGIEFFSLNLRFLNHYENKHMGILTEELTKLIVANIIGIDCCVAACDGHKVHDRIAAVFNENRKVRDLFCRDK